MIRLEHRRQPLLPRRQFLRRMLGSAALAGATALTFLAVGICGYHFLGGLQWLDALVNASMILSGMGPVNPITADSGKWFAAIYALFSGVVFVSCMGVFLAPALHRLLHHLHVETGDPPRR